MKTARLIFVFMILLFIIGCESSTKKESQTTDYLEEMVSVDVGSPPPPIVVSKGHPTILGANVNRDELEFGIDKYIKKMKKANMVFNPPSEITVGTAHVMKLLIDFRKSVDKLKKSFRKSEVLSERNLSVSDLIEVKLSGSAFEIEQITPARQYLSRIETNIWKWSVTPTKVGEHELELVVTAIFNKDNGKEIHRLRTFEERIIVKNIPIEEQVIEFFKQEYKWLFATFFIPIFLWFIKKRRDKAKDRDE